MADVKLTPEVRDVLERSAIDATSVRLPEQLERKAYEAVNKVLVLAGGKWNRSAKAHVFSGDPRAKLGLVLETGVAVDNKKRLQQFWTPTAVCRTVVEAARIVGGDKVLEPSAGIGHLALAARDAGGDVDCVEVDPECAAALRRLRGLGVVSCRDFLTIQPKEVGIYDRVVMNPPFAKNQDVKHVAHALKFLKPGGILAAVMWPNVDRKPFMELLSRQLAGRRHAMSGVERGAFKESGTEVPAIILVVEA